MCSVSGAWERTSPSKCADENRGGLFREVRAQPLVCVQNELPGNIQDLREDMQHQPCNVHNTHLDQVNNAGKPPAQSTLLACITYIVLCLNTSTYQIVCMYYMSMKDFISAGNLVII